MAKISPTIKMPTLPKAKTLKSTNPKPPTIKNTGLSGYLKASKML